MTKRFLQTLGLMLMVGCLIVACDDKKADGGKKADDKKADTKADDSKADEKKADEKKADDSKADDTKADDSKADDSKADDTKADDKPVDNNSSSGTPTNTGGLAKADTPKQLLLNMLDVFEKNLKGDVGKLLDPQAANHAELTTIMTSVVDVTHSMKKLQDAAVAKYGEEAKAMLSKEGGPGDSPFMDLKNHIEKAQIEESGDTATVTAEGLDDDPLKLVKRGDAWYMDASQLDELAGDEGPGIELVTKMMGAMSKASSDGMKLVEENATIAEFKPKFEAAMQQAMAPIMAEIFQKALQEQAKQNQPGNNNQPSPDKLPKPDDN